jgi:hypothetical protein
MQNAKGIGLQDVGDGGLSLSQPNQRKDNDALHDEPRRPPAGRRQVRSVALEPVVRGVTKGRHHPPMTWRQSAPVPTLSSTSERPGRTIDYSPLARKKGSALAGAFLIPARFARRETQPKGRPPFVIMEWSTNSAQPRSNFSGFWFIAMRLAAAVFLFVALSMVQSMRGGNFAVANPVITLLKIGLLFVIAWSWVGLVIDQWPCFLGATGC